jgi:hypothetical protein
VSDGVSLDGLSAALAIAVEREGPSVRFEAADVQRDLTALLAWAQADNVELKDLEVVRPTLDDVFVQLAGPPPTTEERTPGK